MNKVERRYIEVAGRRVHYRRAGEGPPLVMLHGSPGDGEMLGREMAAAAQYFTCFALDTPGFGSSDALPGETLMMRDLAGATAAAMVALGLPPCPVYGTHTGAVIAIELGVGWPERATGLVLEGLPIFTESEIARLFEGYFEPMVTDPLGGHLIRTWMRFRDQFTWFPWLSRDVARLNPIDRPSPDEIDQWVSMFYRSCKTYGPAYRAACFHGQRSHQAAVALELPAVYATTIEDMLHSHLERLPALKAGQRIAPLPSDCATRFETIARYARALPQAPDAPIDSEWRLVGNAPACQYVDAPDGQVFVRCYGNPDNPPLILLHDAPGTGLALETLAQRLAERLYVVLPDLPGNGESDDCDRQVLDSAADAILVVADRLGLKHFALAGIGCGCAVAAILGARREPRITRILLESVPVADEAVAMSIAPELPLSPEGAHWVKAWLMVRDSQIYSPWFDGRISAQRRSQGNFEADWLHDQTVAIMRARISYHRLPQEAHRFDSHAALSAITTPVHFARENELASLAFETLIPEGVA